MRVTVERSLVHRCPYVDETDVGTVKASWNWDGDEVELHAFAKFLDSWADTSVSHERITEKIAKYLHDGVGGVEVVTTWRTAGMDVEVRA